MFWFKDLESGEEEILPDLDRRPSSCTYNCVHTAATDQLTIIILFILLKLEIIFVKSVQFIDCSVDSICGVVVLLPVHHLGGVTGGLELSIQSGVCGGRPPAPGGQNQTKSEGDHWPLLSQYWDT